MMHKYRNKKTLAQSTVKATVNHPVAPAIFQSLKDQIYFVLILYMYVHPPARNIEMFI